ncbi:MAG: Serine phosphatase RsbU, regulator of sigma subunit [uncultured Solirubrobacterales bacterium]|uniref:Serine phosphatase RsbU, regulator of sigma subunit n=1 Tax=uncultured Solirubrobacterales bacterium TaxID=768556 RepID=A0A6J4SSP4_9ACTN|nr:MAG: Serine phosphatase RsbU, regulator of sigma subunit [uncultured Solirubrobacterales bacterium]
MDETSPSRRGGSAAAEPLFRPLEGGALRPLGAVPPSIQWIVTAIGGLAALALGAGLLAAWRARRGERRRRALLDDIGLLQGALLPPVADRVGGLCASVAYRPWDGPGAGGDFYDVFALPGGRDGVVLGDVEGHGREVIGATAALRHSLRAYLEAGLEPRAALELAGEVLGRDPAATMATAVLAVHDPRSGMFTWAGAGHPPPILLGGEFGAETLTAAAAPPLGAATATGLRQTSVYLPRGSAACLFTDGLIDARAGGGRLGLDRLGELAENLGDRLSASTLLDAVGREASEITDDMAVCVLRPTARSAGEHLEGAHGRVEELALPPGQISTSLMQRFLWACGVEADEAQAAMSAARETAREGAGVLLRVETEGRAPVAISQLGRATLAPVP